MRTSFLSFVFFVTCIFHAFASVHCCLVVTCWERAELLALVGDDNCIFFTFPCGDPDQVWYMIVSFLDLFRLSYFAISSGLYFSEYRFQSFAKVKLS